jgi:hypothetical protein
MQNYSFFTKEWNQTGIFWFIFVILNVFFFFLNHDEGAFLFDSSVQKNKKLFKKEANWW